MILLSRILGTINLEASGVIVHHAQISKFTVFKNQALITRYGYQRPSRNRLRHIRGARIAKHTVFNCARHWDIYVNKPGFRSYDILDRLHYPTQFHVHCLKINR